MKQIINNNDDNNVLPILDLIEVKNQCSIRDAISLPFF